MMDVLKEGTLKETGSSRNFNEKIRYVKDWLGHSTIKTTADIYGHLDAGRKKHENFKN
ncbi:MAG: hypothetical protein K6C12_14865 [Oscillospiraceae bacterium]|nr:hypothetical protein [Oscillospiraceae bacterium]